MSEFLGIYGDDVKNFIPFQSKNDFMFSFRKLPNEEGGLNICPSSMRNTMAGIYNHDMSLRNMTFDGESVGQPFQEIINQIPAVQIREYAQDSRIVQIQNAFAAFKKGWDMFKDKPAGDLWKDIKKFLGNIQNEFPKALQEVFKSIASIRGMEDIVGNIDSVGEGFGGENYASYVLHIPAIMYYGMMTARTTGYYTVPYSGKMVDASNGAEGWNMNHGFSGLNTSEYSMVGQLANFFGKNIKFNTTPTWDGNTKQDYPQMEVSFQLFNDTMEAALTNYMFINTIFAKNRFYQYHIFQQNPCVYDLKIEGYGRFYMCSGNMHCDYKGVSRNPPMEFLKKLASYATSGYGLTADKMDENKLVRIPDVYDVKLTFQSILPNSLNNYLYRFTQNNDMENGGFSPVTDECSPKFMDAAQTAAKNAAKDTGLEPLFNQG